MKRDGGLTARITGSGSSPTRTTHCLGHLLDGIGKVEEKDKLTPDSMDGRFCEELKAVFKQTIDAWNEYRRG